MKINSIKLYNFRQFKNDIIEFSQDEEKKVTIIIGNNTSGKTTIVKAFLWCLYRVNRFEDKILLNNDILQSLSLGDTAEVSVSIELDHANYTYKITTKEVYGKNIDSTASVKIKANTHIVKVNSDGSQIIPELKVDEEISNILSSGLKDYFFFDGEDNTIEAVTKKSNLKDAVSDLMGLKRMELLKEYYDPSKTDSVTSKLRSKLISSDDDKLDLYTEKFNKAQLDIDNANSDLLTIQSEIIKIDNQISDKEKEIDLNSDVKDDQDAKKTLQKNIDKFRMDRDKKIDEIVRNMNQSNALLKFLFTKSYISNEIESIVNGSSFSKKESLSHISEDAIDQLIERGYCLCGAKIETNTDAYYHLLSEKDHMEPRDFGKYASDFSDFEKNNQMYSSDFYNNFYDLCDSMIDTVTSIDDTKDALKEIEKKISGRVDVGELQKDVIEFNRQKGTQQGKMEYIKNTLLPSYQSEYEKYKGLIDKITESESGNDFVKECLKYAERIFKRLDTRIANEREEIRAKLENVVGDIFKSMYHGNRIITIDSEFNANAKPTSKINLDKSKGLETVKNFAFVTGLMQLVKNKINSSDDDEEEYEIEESYPLIMDAPFSNTDEVHIKNICSSLPSYCNQIIIIVMKKDFNYANESMSDKIGKQYVLEKHSETFTTIKEVI